MTFRLSSVILLIKVSLSTSTVTLRTNLLAHELLGDTFEQSPAHSRRQDSNFKIFLEPRKYVLKILSAHTHKW